MKSKLQIFMVFLFLGTLSFFSLALVFGLVSPPVYAQTLDAWNIHRQGAGNDLNFYYSLSGLPALKLNTNGQMRARAILDINGSARMLDLASGGSSNLNALTLNGALNGTTGSFSGAVTGASYSGGAISGTTGTFTGAVSGTTGTFSGAVSGASSGAFSGQLTVSGASNLNGGIYSPILRDSDASTTYYVDPSGTSVFNATRNKGRHYSEEWIEFVTSGTGLYSTINAAYLYPNNNAYGAWRIAGSRNGWYGLEFDTNAGQLALMMGHTSQNSTNQYTGIINQSNGNWVWYAIAGDMYADTFRDKANGGYYLDPAGFSNLYDISVPGWYRIQGGTGMYWAAYGGQLWMDSPSHVKINKYISAPRMDDYDNGAYLVDPNWNSVFNNIYWWTSQYNSDARLKKDIVPLTGSLDKILKLRGVNYSLRVGETDVADILKEAPQGKQIGLIAQEVQPVVPEVVSTNPQGYLAIDYGKLTGLLIEGIKEQQTQIKNQDEKISTLEKDIADLKTQMSKLQNQQ